jgi:ribose 5-phosphate isomerase B
MDRSQSEWLLERTPQAGDRIRTLGLCEAYKELREIPAVAGHTLADYQSTFHQIERAVLGLIDDWGFFRDRFFIQRKLHVAIGADHRGFAMKKTIIAHLEKAGHRVLDCGAYNSQPSDHPIIAIVVGEAVAQEAVDRGILICASGLGMSISANKVRGVRAALCINPDHAALSRTHNNANVLCLAADCFPEKEELEIIKVWMSTPFLGGKYQRRNNIISCQEDSYRRDLSANDRPTMPDDSAE